MVALTLPGAERNSISRIEGYTFGADLREYPPQNNNDEETIIPRDIDRIRRRARHGNEGARRREARSSPLQTHLL